MNILIVDDSPTFQHVQYHIVGQMGHNAILAESAETAIALLSEQDHAVDLILMDVQLPGLSGFEATRIIKTTSKMSHVWIIVVSCSENDSDYIEARKSGADAFLKKPFDANQLQKKINRLTRKNANNVQKQNSHQQLCS